jgi:starch-binding outer membrane protein, SusD/RagB family
MKKRILFIISIAVMLMAETGCKKWLEEDPKTFIAPDAFFTNAGSYESAVIGIYSGLPLYSGNKAMLLEMCTDIYGNPSSAFEQALPMYQNAPQAFYYNTREAWSGAYAIIKNANYIIGKLPDASVLDDTKKAQLTAEARFLRAYAYFYLVQLYGDVPMPVTTATNYDSLQLKRTAQADVYKLIVDDLTYAETNLPDNAPVTGRVYKLAATALSAKVYLTMAGNPLNQTQYYANAKEKATTVINSNKFALVDDYSGVFHNTTYTTESIWEKTYVIADGGNPVHGITLTAKTINAILVPASWYINSFAKGDSRKTWGIVQDFKDNINNTTLAPFFLKFADTSDVNKPGVSAAATRVSYTFPYLRLAEMYLIAAEAENEMNGPADAYQYINKIRWRARTDKSDPTNVPDLSGLSKDDFRKAVLMERKWELSLEGNTWFDLKRTNTLSDIQTIRGSGLINPIGTYNQTWLIPDNEVINNDIPQNPLY